MYNSIYNDCRGPSCWDRDWFFRFHSEKRDEWELWVFDIHPLYASDGLMDIFAAFFGGRLDHRKTIRCIEFMNFSPRPQFCEMEAFLSIPNPLTMGRKFVKHIFFWMYTYRFCRYAIFSEGGFWYTGFHRGIDSLPFKESVESVICQH